MLRIVAAGGPEFDCALILRMTFDERPGPCLALCFVVLSMATGFCSYICARESIEIEADFTYVKAVWGSGMLLVTGMCMYPVESDWSKVIEVLCRAAADGTKVEPDVRRFAL